MLARLHYCGHGLTGGVKGIYMSPWWSSNLLATGKGVGHRKVGQ